MASSAVKATSENRTWDDAEYEKLARARREDAYDEKVNRFAEKKSVSVRQENLDLEKKVGTKSKFNAHPDAKRTGKGFWCAVCELEFLDSNSYVNHINSRFHQSKLGKSMVITESSLSEVKMKLLAQKKRAKNVSSVQANNDNSTKMTKVERYELKRQQVENEARERKRQKKKHKRNDQSCPEGDPSSNGDGKIEEQEPQKEDGEAEEDDEMKQMKMMMGFGSFS